MRVSDNMLDADTVDEMADAFHPTQRVGTKRWYHREPEINAIEAALLWAAGRIKREEFLDLVELLEVEW